MHIDVLEEDTLVRVGWVDVWVSLYWEDAYRTMGRFTLEVRPTPENLSLLREGRWLKRSDSDLPMRICDRSQQDQDAPFVCSGFAATWLLTRRVSTTIIKDQPAEAAMRQLVADMAPWPRLELGQAGGFDTRFDKRTSSGSVFEYCETIAAACDLGFRIRLTGKGRSKKLLFEVYRPTADPNHRYSTAWGTLTSLGWRFADTDYANVAIVQGAGEGEDRATVTVGDTAATGSARREIYVDARDVQPDEEKGETAQSASYLTRLTDRGGKKLLEQLRTGVIEFDPEDEGLHPGDVLRVQIPEMGYRATVRVAAVILQSQADRTTCTTRLGTPVWTKY